ncbi:MAG: NAD(P)-dependent oxidoreductase [Candidatus Micrarchaeota archaeon]|nr:NAD(P)-dependent oxidoreductase [Candidatus Micrarchaeota archaeon]MDE1834138.1 NAD(P)-dependent oxidoreductase [Candidatus Micrarchaeota archaeon]MDE1859535.1 NAD(P)-dependent oxidoreductase [Candidatus Micrarchaeota archaeon]
MPTAKKLAITGCSGFIGRNAVSYALKHGYHVVGIDINLLDIEHKNLVFIKGDINNKKLLEKAIKGCNYVLHLAAATSLPDFQYDLHKNYSTNVLGFLNVIDAAKRNKSKKFVYASSSAVYQNDYGEDATIDVKTLRNHYGKSKLIDEMLADSYADAYKMSTVGLRYFNIYGPGEEVKERSSPITQFLISKRRDGTIKIFGNGKQAKDFTHIDDAIKITFRLMEDKKSSGVYNVGTGIATSFNYIAKMMKPKKIIYVKNPYLSSYIFYLKADKKRLQGALKKYRFITVKEGISRLMKTE